MGKLLEDIRMEFANKFSQESLTGVPSSNVLTANHTIAVPSADTTPRLTTVSASEVPADSPGNLRSSMFERLSTPPELDHASQTSTIDEDMEQTIHAE